MKNKMIGVCLLVFLIIQPIFANAQYSTTLNGVAYETTYPVIERDDMVYLSLSDFCSAGLITVTPTESNAYVLLGSDPHLDLEIRAESRRYVLDGEEKYLVHPTLVSSNQIYLPVILFAELGYPYNFDLDNNTLELFSLTPYSRNPDNPNRHTFASSTENLNNLPSHTIAFSSLAAVQSIINESTEQELFLSFASNTMYPKVREHFTPRFEFSPYNNMFVTFRSFNSDAIPNTVGRTMTFPLKVNLSRLGAILTIGDELFSYPMMWSTFYPEKSLTDIDLTKSADLTIMRALYEYYRNTYGLRDDKYFSPFTTVTSDRTNTMTQSVYTESLEGVTSEYDVTIYRVHPTGSLHYIVDIVAQ